MFLRYYHIAEFFRRLSVACVITASFVATTGLADTSNDSLVWLDDYAAAYQQAVDGEKMLLVYFQPKQLTVGSRQFEETTLQDAQVQALCQKYVLARLSVDATTEIDGREIRLLRHPGFAHMNGREGLAIVDLRNRDQPYYTRAVSCLPFESPVYYAPNYYSTQSVRTLLDLPPGTISQRTMIYAVRMHPENPASTAGQPHPELFAACTRHSGHQASIRTQGHHNWDSRFQRIWSRVGGRHPVEVCAESWPGKGLLAASIDCVHSWRQSSGHWNAVRSPQPAFGYDIRMGSNGIWYATGVFGGLQGPRVKTVEFSEK